MKAKTKRIKIMRGRVATHYDVTIGPAPVQTDEQCNLLQVFWCITGPHFFIRGLAQDDTAAQDTVKTHLRQLGSLDNGRPQRAPSVNRKGIADLRAAKTARNWAEQAAARYDGTAPDWVLLIADYLNEGGTQRDLAERLNVQAQIVSAAMNNSLHNIYKTDAAINRIANRVRHYFAQQKAA